MDPIEKGIDPAHVSLQLLVNQWVEAFNAHNVASIVALYADDADLFDSGMKHPRHGRAEIERWFARRFFDMPTITYTPTNQLFASEYAAMLWTASGRSPRILGQSWLSRSFQVDGVSIFTVRDGYIQSQRGYYDHLSILERILPPLTWLPFRL
jgi:steroid delta-isomerase-like uncharacterized protein